MILVLGPGARRSRAQVTLADDIILAAQGKENAERERGRQSPLGRPPGTAAIPYQRSPGSTDIMLGVSPTRRLAPLPRPTARLSQAVPFDLPDRGPLERGHGLAPLIERLPQREARPPGRAAAGPGARVGTGPTSDAAVARGPRALGSPDDDRRDSDIDEGDPNGLTLDAAIERLVHSNRELRTK